MVSLQESTNFAFEKECLQKPPLCHPVWFLGVPRGLRVHLLEAQNLQNGTMWCVNNLNDALMGGLKVNKGNTGCWAMEYCDFYPSRAFLCLSFITFFFFFTSNAPPLLLPVPSLPQAQSLPLFSYPLSPGSVKIPCSYFLVRAPQKHSDLEYNNEAHGTH